MASKVITTYHKKPEISLHFWFCFRKLSFAQNTKLAPVPALRSSISSRQWPANTSNITTANTCCSTDTKSLGSCTCNVHNVTSLVQHTACHAEAKRPLWPWSSLKWLSKGQKYPAAWAGHRSENNHLCSLCLYPQGKPKKCIPKMSLGTNCIEYQKPWTL